ncbi:hypothetical protein [Dokdonella sp.]|uniref:hypothetical protein n=1 Tax=Dokdonella sp. TaxID=2291710 RepID=UPI0025BF70E9|nr:hypothetical protein [Dokdonella sp.]MBX3693092.1 hypothetical protein [Dokdonella sp.]MCW5567840.1 hypothetical protein [Dokdonella sp.]
MDGLRHRLIRLHWLGFVLLALCVLARPALELASELHSDLHALAHAGLALDEAGERAEHAPPEGWHVLMHIDACCCTPVLPAATTVELAALLPGFVAIDHAPGIPPYPRPDLLRPPISG